MPDKSGKMSDDEYKRAQDWLAEKRANRMCDICHNEHTWSLSPHVISFKSFSESDAPSTHYVSFHMVCAECGNVRIHNMGEPDMLKDLNEQYSKSGV